ncbi:hypothetical protein Tco_0988892 [Tanacetum coccineum]|uniref:Reverse transcriptase domain-containing protein n=1 Tax=Tanacetum coccineum TaxID=301880 RepID=A0ABQ5ESV6_9ASTR
MDDEPMWAADRVVAPTPGFAITILETANEFAIKGSSNSDTDKIMAQMDTMTLKMDAQYKELQTYAKKTKTNLDEDDIPMSRKEEAKFMQTFHNYRSNTDDKPCDLQKQFNDFMKSQQSTNAFVKETFMDLKTQLETVAKNHQASIQNLETKFDILADKQSGRPSGSLPINLNDQPTDSETPINFDSDDEDEEPTPQPKTQNPKPVKENPLPKPYKLKIPYPQCLRKEKMEAQYGKFLDMICTIRINVPLIDVLAGMPNYGKFLKDLISNKHKIEQIYAAFLSDESSAMIQNKVPPKLGDPGKEDFDALLDEGSKILHSIEGTLLKEEIFDKFDEFMAMTTDENSDSESDTEDAPFKKITINTDYKIKTSLEEPPTDLKLKPLPNNLEYVFLEEPSFLHVIISSQLSKEKKSKLIYVLKKHKQAFA